MTTDFPTAIDDFTNPTPSDDLDTPAVLHSDQHANINDAVEALEAKVGVDGSAVTTSLDYKLTNASSSDPGHTHTVSSISGTLPLSKGGTNATSFTSARLVYSDASSLLSAAALTYAASGTNLTITAQNSADIPFAIVGAASPSTANLLSISITGEGEVFRIVRSGDSVAVQMSETGGSDTFGTFSFGDQSVFAFSGLRTTTGVLYFGSGTGESTSTYNEGGVSAISVNAGNTPASMVITGRAAIGASVGIGIGQATPGAVLHAQAAVTTRVVMLARGAASQTGNLFEAQNSAGTPLTYIEPDGEIVIDQDSKAIKFGADQDATILYDGTNLVINPKAVGSGVLSVTGDLSLLDEDIVLGTTTGTKIGTSATQKLSFWNAAPVVQSTGWSVSNVSSDKSFDANSTSIDELADVLGTLITALLAYGVLGA